jgi:hypothetical protein
MAQTRTTAIKTILQDLGVLDRAGTVSSNDSTTVGTRYDAGVSALSTRDVITIADPVNGIPDDAFLPLVAWMVQECAPSFHQERNAEVQVAAEGWLRAIAREGFSVGGTTANRLAAEVLRMLGRLAPDEAPSTKDEAFITARTTDAINDLYARDIIAYSSAGSIVAATFNPLAAYVAQIVAPKFGKETDPAALATFERWLAATTRFANTTSTVAEGVIADVLISLGRLGLGELPSTKDKTLVSTRIDNALASLSARDVITLANQAAITTTHANAITNFIIQETAPKFGKSPDVEAKAHAEAELRRIARLGYSVGGTIDARLGAEVLRMLGRLQPDEAPSTAEAAFVSGRLTDAINDLYQRDIIAFSSAGAITNPSFDALARFVAELVAPKFGRPSDPEVMAAAEAALRRIARLGYTVGGTTAARLGAEVLRLLGRLAPDEAPSAAEAAFIATPITDAINDLYLRDLIAFSTAGAITNPSFDALANYVAELVAPKFGRQTDPNAMAAAEAQLRRIARLGYSVGGTTAARLGAEVLRQLGRLAPDEAPSTAEAAFVALHITDAINDLYQRDVIAYSAAADITAPTFDALKAYVAELVAPKFGRATDPQVMALHEAALRRITRRGYTVGGTIAARLGAEVLRMLGRLQVDEAPSTAEATAIAAPITDAITDLYQRDVIAFSSAAAITATSFDALASYVAELVAPRFGRPTEPKAMAAAEQALFAIARQTYTVGSTVAAKLAARILRGLEHIGPTGAPSSRETTLITGKVIDALNDLDRRGVIFISDVEDVSNVGAFDALADYMVAVLLPEFGSEGMAGRLGPLSTVKRRDAEQRLRRIGAEAPGYGMLVGTYF